MGTNCGQKWMVKNGYSWRGFVNVVVDLTNLQMWQYVDNHRLQEDDVSMSWLCQPVRRSVANYSAEVIADQTFS